MILTQELERVALIRAPEIKQRIKWAPSIVRRLWGRIWRARLDPSKSIPTALVEQLELAFSDKTLRDLCESQLKAERALGIAIAKTLRARLADLRDAHVVDDIVAGPPKVLEEEPPGRIVIPIGEDRFLSFCANHASIPKRASGVVNWSKVTRVKILAIGGLDA